MFIARTFANTRLSVVGATSPRRVLVSRRDREEWRFTLRSGILRLGGVEFIFDTCPAAFVYEAPKVDAGADADADANGDGDEVVAMEDVTDTGSEAARLPPRPEALGPSAAALSSEDPLHGALSSLIPRHPAAVAAAAPSSTAATTAVAFAVAPASRQGPPPQRRPLHAVADISERPSV